MNFILQLEDHARGVMWRRVITDAPGLPRAGEDIILTRSEWTEPVARIWWDFSPDATRALSATVLVTVRMLDSEVEELEQDLVQSQWYRP